MRKKMFGLILSVFSISLFAGDRVNCYDAYKQKFAERGANEIKDGWHENVVITFRQGNEADCVLGKVKVEKGSVTQMYLKSVDGTYQVFTKKFKYEDIEPVVSNGISKSKLTIDHEVVNVIFPASIKSPEKKIAAAPNPDDISSSIGKSTKINSVEDKNNKIVFKASGTGFFISKEGIVATNSHVIVGANLISVEVTLNGIKKNYIARVLRIDHHNDIAILKLDSFPKLNSLPYKIDFNQFNSGTKVFTLGYPQTNLLGKDMKFTEGSISSKSGFQGDITRYQISVPIQPGNSGGPLFNESGNVIGITSGGINKNLNLTENVNYAIKSVYLRALIESFSNSIKLSDSNKVLSLSITKKVNRLSKYVVLIKTL
jgi:S1-C subfamily serine protease